MTKIFDVIPVDDYAVVVDKSIKEADGLCYLNGIFTNCNVAIKLMDGEYKIVASINKKIDDSIPIIKIFNKTWSDEDLKDAFYVGVHTGMEASLDVEEEYKKLIYFKSVQKNKFPKQVELEMEKRDVYTCRVDKCWCDPFNKFCHFVKHSTETAIKITDPQTNTIIPVNIII